MENAAVVSSGRRRFSLRISSNWRPARTGPRSCRDREAPHKARPCKGTATLWQLAPDLRRRASKRRRRSKECERSSKISICEVVVSDLKPKKTSRSSSSTPCNIRAPRDSAISRLFRYFARRFQILAIAQCGALAIRRGAASNRGVRNRVFTVSTKSGLFLAFWEGLQAPATRLSRGWKG